MLGERADGSLRATLSDLPRTGPLDLDLHFTTEGEARIPFHAHVRQHITVDTQFDFPQFQIFPPELQIRVLSVCDTPTLFQLMRVSSTIRKEASKLFWGRPNVSFEVGGYWLIEGGYPGDTYYDTSFFPYVRNIIITCDWEMSRVMFAREGYIDESRQDIADTHVMQKFWKTLKKRFPSARRVIINNSIPTPRPPNESALEVPEQFLQHRPPGIELCSMKLWEDMPVIGSAAGKPSAPKVYRDFYKHIGASGWQKFSTFGQVTVLMPAKVFRGPSGNFESFRYREQRLKMQENAQLPLLVEAVQRQHFDKGHAPISCPIHECRTPFEKAAQWTEHALEMHFYDMFWTIQSYFYILPEELQKAFEDRDTRLRSQKQELVLERRKLIEEWIIMPWAMSDAQATQKLAMRRREVERAWTEQLEKDELNEAQHISKIRSEGIRPGEESINHCVFLQSPIVPFFEDF